MLRRGRRIFQLACGSPCIDGGLTNPATYATANDIRGQPRPIDGTGLGTPKFDIGAYEFNPATDESVGIRPTLGFSTFAVLFSAGFVAQISGCADYYWWSFGDGTTVSNLPTISHVWTSPGTYTVTLNAHYPDSGLTISASNLVQVLSQPVYYVNATGSSPQPPYTNWLHALYHHPTGDWCRLPARAAGVGYERHLYLRHASQPRRHHQ